MIRRLRFLSLFFGIVFRRFNVGVWIFPKTAWELCKIIHGSNVYKRDEERILRYLMAD